MTSLQQNLSLNKLSNNNLLIENSNKNFKKLTINDEILNTKKYLQCLICKNFSTVNLTNMIEHLEIDRSQIYLGDIQVNNHFYYYYLIIYFF